MLKGRVKTIDFYSNQDPLSATEKQTVSPRQDTMVLVKTSDSTLKSDSTPTAQNISVTTKNSDGYSQKQLDSLFIVAEKREKLIKWKSDTQKAKADSAKLESDTISVSNPSVNSNPSFSWLLPEHFLTQNSDSVQLQKNSINLSKNTTISLDKNNDSAYLEGNLRAESNMNWLILIILISLFIFSWIKSTYEKFIVQIIAGIVNYQVSIRLFHERNILFRNVSFALHATFYLNIGLFIFFLIENRGFVQVFPSNFLSMFSYSIAFFLLYSVKLVSGKIISHIFLFQEEFAEYIHNVFLFNKNIGLMLFPIIIIYPFTEGKIKPLLLYAGLILIIIMLLLRMYRGFQIIMRKGVNPFYLILYLCAVEILPVLLLVKFVDTLI